MAPTKKQELAAKEIVENGGIISKAMEKVGYSKATAKTPQKLTESKGYKEATKPFVKQLDEEIQAAMKHLPKVRSKAGYGEAVSSVEKMRKLKELLEGNSTENNKLEIIIKEQ